MSTLLDEAIIDAAEARKAFERKVKNEILEEHSTEIKEAISLLMEQEESLESFFSDTGSAEEAPMAMGVDLSDHDVDLSGQVPYTGSELMGKDGSDSSPYAPDSDEDGVEITLDLKDFAKSMNPELYEEPEPEEDSVEDFEEEPMAEEPMAEEPVDFGAEEVVPEAEPTPEAGTETDTGLLEVPDAVLQEALEMLVQEEMGLENIESEVAKVIEGLEFDYEPKPTGWGFGANTPTAYKLEAHELVDAVEQLEEKNEELEEKNKQKDKEYSELKESFDILENILEDYKDKNKELASIARKLEKKLNEVNLSNAKLLYTNRALNSSSLNERQKQKLVESISKANTIEEAKVIYETLEDTIGSFSRNERKPKNLSEAISRSASPYFPKRESSESNEQKVFADRMKRLAGINS